MAKEPVYFDYPEYGKSSEFYADLNLLENEKVKVKFIKNIERIIRTSPEYREYIKYLKTTVMLTQCSVMNMLPEEVSQQITIEMHHCPLTLYDLTDIILTRAITLGHTFTMNSIANDVMVEHFLNKVGLAPLTKTIHQMVHTGTKLLNHKDIFGNYNRFAEEYKTFLTEEHLNKIETVNSLSDRTVAAGRSFMLEINPQLYEAIDHNNYTRVELPPPEGDDSLDEDAEQIALAPKKTKKKSKPVIEIEE